MSDLRSKLDADIAKVVAGMKRLPYDEQFVVGEELHRGLMDASSEVAKVRRAAVRELRSQGFTLQSIGDLVGVSANRIYQIEKGMGRKEKAGTR